MWKVAIYASAAPLFLEELDNHVDGAILANNPASAALTFIQEMYSKKKQKLPISLMVSVGSGVLPEDKLGRTDVQKFLSFGAWFESEGLFARVSNLMTLFSNAVCIIRIWTVLI